MSNRWVAVFAATALIAGAAGCSVTVSMSDDVLAECIALTEGSLGGSTSIVSGVVLRLPEGASGEDAQAEFNRRFSTAYGISVDEFLALRNDADEETRSRMGDAPQIGEQASNEWFIERDRRLMAMWHERHPQSARTYCELVVAETP